MHEKVDAIRVSMIYFNFFFKSSLIHKWRITKPVSLSYNNHFHLRIAKVICSLL